jgi:hypothetical protein
MAVLKWLFGTDDIRVNQDERRLDYRTELLQSFYPHGMVYVLYVHHIAATFGAD